MSETYSQNNIQETTVEKSSFELKVDELIENFKALKEENELLKVQLEDAESKMQEEKSQIDKLETEILETEQEKDDILSKIGAVLGDI
jgi:predicted  nucleic acid-binding Zn-ribbon protein